MIPWLIIALVAAVFAVVFGSWLLDEPITLSMLAGGVVILLGTALSTGLLSLPSR